MSTETIEEVKKGTVSQSEIDSIIKGEDLIRVYDSDLEELFGLPDLRKKMMIRMIPLFHDAAILGSFMGALLLIGTLITVFVIPIISLVHLFYTLAVISTIISTGFLLANIMGGLHDDNVKKKLVSTLSSIVICSSSAYTATIVYPMMTPNNVSNINGFMSCIAGAGVVAAFYSVIYVYNEFKNFTKPAVRLKYKSDYIDNMYREHSIKEFISKYDIPKSVEYNLLVHGMDNKYTDVMFVKPILQLDAYANEKERRRLAMDPAVLLRTKHEEWFLVGAWDILGDHDKIIAEASTKTKEAISGVADRISKASKGKLLKILKDKTNSSQ